MGKFEDFYAKRKAIGHAKSIAKPSLLDLAVRKQVLCSGSVKKPIKKSGNVPKIALKELVIVTPVVPDQLQVVRNAASLPGVSSGSVPVNIFESAVKNSSDSRSFQDAKSLIPTYLHKTIRDSTRKCYQNYWSRFEKFCADSSVSISSESVSAFLISLAEQSKGKGSSLMARNAIKFFYKIRFPFKKSPTDSWHVKRIVKSIKKQWSKPVKKATVISSDILKKVLPFLLRSSSDVSVKDERLAVMILLQFCIFARFEEVQSLRVSNLKVLDSGHLEVVIPKAKNFENWDARSSYIANNPESCFNAVEIISNYISKLNYQGDGLLFPSLRSTGKKGNLVKKIKLLLKPISYNCALKEFRSALSSVGLDGKKFSLHSLRTGGLSEAANSGLCSVAQLRRQGRWSSDKMADYYHKMSLDMKLQASRALNILN